MWIMWFLACGSSESDPGDSCTTISDCTGDTVCLAVGQGDAECALTCSASADECGAEASCAGVASLSIDVCQPTDSATSSENAPGEEERTSIPCRTDNECQDLHPQAVCATWNGWKECAMSCVEDGDCNPPPIGGVTTSFLVCDADQGNTSRDVCLPNEACFNNPMGCIQIEGWGTPTGGSDTGWW